MKKCRKFLIALFILCMCASMLSTAAFAEEGVYKVTVYAGNRGTTPTGEKYEVTHVYAANGDNQVNLSSLIDNKYVNAEYKDKFFIRGIVEAGYDYSVDGLSAPNVLVDSDKDFVLVYGVYGDVVQYTVRYITADGVALATETVGYSNAGEQIIVGCKDVTGYLPQAYNLAKTLDVDESKNILEFIYTPIPADTEPQQGQPVQEPNANVEGDYNIEQIPQPAQIINLDEEEVPLANLDANKDRDWKALAKPLIIGGVILLIGLFALMILLDSKKKKEEKEV